MPAVGEPAELTAASLPRAVQVVVAGGGPDGLACAVELGRRGIGCLVVEPRTTVSRARPRCKTVNVRSMQHLRRWGIAGRLRDRAPLSPAWSQDAVFCTSGSRCWGAVRVAAGARLREPPVPGACRCACLTCQARALIRTAPRWRWSAPTSTWRGPATVSPTTAWR
jgi:hypothetical protein